MTMLYKDILKKPKPLPRDAVIRLCIGGITCLALISIIYIGMVPYGSQPQIGKVADRDIYAPFDFSYDAGEDAARTEELKKAAVLSVKDVYDIDADGYENAASNIKSLFAAVIEAKKGAETGLDEKIDRLKGADKLGLPENTLKTLLQSPETEQTETFLLNKLARVFSEGIITPEEKEGLIKQGRTLITVRNLGAKSESVLETKNIKTVEDLRPQLPSLFDDPAIDKKLKAPLAEIVLKSLSEDVKSNIVETSARREKAISGIEPQRKSVGVEKGELIIQQGEKFTPFNVAKIEAVRKDSSNAQKFTFSMLGISLIVLALVIIPSLYLSYYEPMVYYNNRYLSLVALLIIIITAMGKAISVFKASELWIPVAIAPMLISLLLGARPAMVIAITLSFLTGIVTGGKFEFSLIFLIGSIAGIYGVKGARRRRQLFNAGFLSGIVSSCCIIGFGILNSYDPHNIANDAGITLFNGLFVGALLTGTLHIFEPLFQVTTNITLLELADPNNDLLKELILKAPGTYHHSLIVGNLAESACDKIGANGLLARVGAYYHDIGKMEKSEYFAENQPISESQHDKLEPTMSSLIIINHVKEGMEKAKKARLNKALMDFIEQHHGTGLIYYFYQRALESVEDLAKLEEEGFRYPGPKPQTKETAIVHLADSVEAASRTLKNPTPTNLEELVRRIINNKFIDGQLDECELTLKDLNMIAAVFTKVLTGVYHTRVQYPNGNHKSENHG